MHALEKQLKGDATMVYVLLYVFPPSHSLCVRTQDLPALIGARFVSKKCATGEKPVCR